MALYLLSMYQPGGPPPAPEVLAPVMQKVYALNDEMRRAGVWLFTGGLHPPTTATVVRQSGADVLLTDGPYIEGKEHIGGLYVIDVPDLDAALGWARKLAAALAIEWEGEVRGLPIEVRPFQHGERGA